MFSTALKIAAVASLLVAGQAFAGSINPHARCKNGEQLLLPSPNNWGSETQSLEVRTCVNGRFYPRSKVKLGPVCEEGETYLMPGQYEGSGYEFRTCENGRLYPRVKVPAVRGCTEGERLLLPDPRTETSETQQLVEQECRGGVFVPMW